jgi:hypothetical protein
MSSELHLVRQKKLCLTNSRHCQMLSLSKIENKIKAINNKWEHISGTYAILILVDQVEISHAFLTLIWNKNFVFSSPIRENSYYYTKNSVRLRKWAKGTKKLCTKALRKKGMLILFSLYDKVMEFYEEGKLTMASLAIINCGESSHFVFRFTEEFMLHWARSLLNINFFS